MPEHVVKCVTNYELKKTSLDVHELDSTLSDPISRCRFKFPMKIEETKGYSPPLINGLSIGGDSEFKVPPYNPTLSLKYDAQFNIQSVAGIKAVKYMYKYGMFYFKLPM